MIDITTTEDGNVAIVLDGVDGVWVFVIPPSKAIDLSYVLSTIKSQQDLDEFRKNLLKVGIINAKN